jgi:multidrug efflux pump subunit AcrB
VFVPAAFLPGTTGQIYRQFAITIVVSVGVSGLVALTLTPALCALMLRHEPLRTQRLLRLVQPRRRPRHRTVRPGRWCCHPPPPLAAVLLVAPAAARSSCSASLPTGFVPNEDQGYVMAVAMLPGGASLDRSRDVLGQGRRHVRRPTRRSTSAAQMVGCSLIDGGFKSNAATLFVTLKDFGSDTESGRYRPRAEPARSARRDPPPVPPPSTTAWRRRWRRRRSRASAAPRFRDVGAGSTAAGDPVRPGGGDQALHRAARSGRELAARQHHLPRPAAPVAGRRRPRQGAVAGCPGAGRVRCHPGPVRGRSP